MKFLKSFGFMVASGLILATATMQAANAVTLYSVRTSDTLVKIAREHNVSIDHLRRANADLRKSDKVHAGQILIIPDQDEALVPESTGASTYVIHNVSPAGSPPSVTTPHVVKAVAVTPVATAAPVVAVKPAEPEVRENAAPRDTQVIMESDDTTKQEAATPTTPGSHDNVVIIDNQIIRVPSYVKPVDTAEIDRGASPRRSALASRRGSIISAILTMARHFIGVPYVWGGTTASGFDCSGFVMRVFAVNGIHLQRTADAQYYQGTPVKNPEPGDLVFFSTYLPGPSHVGIYLGGNMFIHASSSHGVTISCLGDAFYQKVYIGARRYI